VRGGRGAGIATVALLGLIGASIIGTGGAAAVVGPTDLVLTKTDSADPVAQNANLTYTIRVNNAGAGDATAVTVTDTLPSQVDYVSATPSQGTCNRAGSTVTCALGQVNAGVTATVSIVVKAKKTGTASNTATVTSPEDTTPANNSDTETTVISKKSGKVKASCATPTITGTAGNDVINGTSGNDVIRGFAGNDAIFAGGGGDLICSDTGADRVVGGPGADTMIGGLGPDVLLGSSGKDTIRGKGGRDRLRGQLGNDLLNGGRGVDNCKGGAGRDVLRKCP
jgi:uncharacterized repeat protein (TIGR01451 family)